MKNWIQSLKSTGFRSTITAASVPASSQSPSSRRSRPSTWPRPPHRRRRFPRRPPPRSTTTASARFSPSTVPWRLSRPRHPAVVNVTVTSKGKEHAEEGNGMPDMQQFFGPDGPFGQQGQQFGRQFHFQMQPQNRVEHGLGSGVIISPDGYIVTNNHVIEGATDIRVTMSNKEVMAAKLIGADPLRSRRHQGQRQQSPQRSLGQLRESASGQTVLAFAILRIPVHGHARHHQRAQPRQSDASDRRSPASSFRPTPPSIPATLAVRSSTRTAS